MDMSHFKASFGSFEVVSSTIGNVTRLGSSLSMPCAAATALRRRASDLAWPDHRPSAPLRSPLVRFSVHRNIQHTVQSIRCSHARGGKTSTIKQSRDCAEVCYSVAIRVDADI